MKYIQISCENGKTNGTNIESYRKIMLKIRYIYIYIYIYLYLFIYTSTLTKHDVLFEVVTVAYVGAGGGS